MESGQPQLMRCSFHRGRKARVGTSMSREIGVAVGWRDLIQVLGILNIEKER